MNIRTSGIDNQNRVERRRRFADRKRIAQEEGKHHKDIAMRNDFRLCRENDKTLADYRKFKDPKDREKINAEFFGRQKEYRHYS